MLEEAGKASSNDALTGSSPDEGFTHAVIQAPTGQQESVATATYCIKKIRSGAYSADGAFYRIKWSQFVSDFMSAMWRQRPGERRRQYWPRRSLAVLMFIPGVAYCTLSAYFGETAPAKLLEKYQPKPSQKRSKGKSGYRGEEVEGQRGTSSILFEPTGDDPVVSELGPTQPAIASLKGLESKNLTVKVDGAVVNRSSDAYVVNEEADKVSIIPSCGYWTVGRHRIEVATDDEAGPKARLLFDVTWSLDFSEPIAKVLLDLSEPANSVGKVYTDSNTGCLVLEPKSREDNNPVSCSFSRFVKQLRPFSIGSKFRLHRNRSASVQLSLPGQISVQLFDGGANKITLKQKDKYLAKDGTSLTLFRKRALTIELPDDVTFEQESWIWISWDGKQIAISTGAHGQVPLARISVIKEAVKADDLSFSIRSYGSVVGFSMIKIERFLASLNS